MTDVNVPNEVSEASLVSGNAAIRLLTRPEDSAGLSGPAWGKEVFAARPH